VGLYGRPWLGTPPVDQRVNISERTTAGDHKGPPIPAPFPSPLRMLMGFPGSVLLHFI